MAGDRSMIHQGPREVPQFVMRTVAFDAAPSNRWVPTPVTLTIAQEALSTRKNVTSIVRLVYRGWL